MASTKNLAKSNITVTFRTSCKDDKSITVELDDDKNNE